MQNIIIIGSGPAGLTAAIYAGRANLRPLVISGGADSGGQVKFTNDLENFPGFPDGLNGYELFQLLEKQATKFGAELLYDNVISVDLKGRAKKVKTAEKEFEALSVIIATGSTPKHLGIPGELQFKGHGVSTCATCDGSFYKGGKVAVVGGGNSAIDETLFLTRFVEKATIIHRRDSLRADAILQQRAFANPKIDFIWDTVVEQISGDDVVKLIRLRNVKTSAITDFPVDALFVFIGHHPNVELFQDQITLNPDNTIASDRRMHTNIEGVFACGDVQDSIYRQAITAAASGCQAAMEAVKYIAETSE